MPNRGKSDIKNGRRRLSEQLEVVEAIGLALEPTMSLDEILTFAATKTATLMSAERAALFLVTESGGLVSRVVHGDGVSESRLRSRQGIAGWIARTGRPVIVPDAYEDERFDPGWDRQHGFVTRCVIGQPIRGRRGNVIGVIEVLNRIDARKFDRDDLALLRLISGQLALIVENGRLMVGLVEKNRTLAEKRLDLELRSQELRLLLDLEKLTARADNLDALVGTVLRRMIAITQAGVGVLLSLDDTGAEMRLVCEEHPVVRVLRIERDMGFAGWVATHGKELCIADPRADPRFSEHLVKRVGIPLENLAAVPLSHREEDQTKGALLVANKRSTTGFDESDLALVRTIAARVSLAVEQFTNRETQERERRLATVGRLLASVLHDLKSPITVVSGYAELLAKKLKDDETRDYLGHIYGALSQISKMAEEIISFSRGERGVMFSSVLVEEFTDRFVKQIRPQLEANNIKLKLHRRISGKIRLDEDKMLRAFNNIVLNAVEVMRNGGQLTIELDQTDQEIVFGFTDTGPGIPEEIQGSIFKSFVTMGKEQGTGLGLAVAREVVEAHGGKISFVTAQGVGTTFLVSLPI